MPTCLLRHPCRDRGGRGDQEFSATYGSDLPLQLLRTSKQVHPDQGAIGIGFPGLNTAPVGYSRGDFTRAWFDLLDKPKLDVMVLNHPHVLSKLQRAYLTRSLDAKSRFQAVKNHYRFVASRLSDEAVNCIYSSSELLLAQVCLAGFRRPGSPPRLL